VSWQIEFGLNVSLNIAAILAVLKLEVTCMFPRTIIKI
jgi:hypothetical protein